MHESRARAGLNPAFSGKPLTCERLHFILLIPNYNLPGYISSYPTFPPALITENLMGGAYCYPFWRVDFA